MAQVAPIPWRTPVRGERPYKDTAARSATQSALTSASAPPAWSPAASRVITIHKVPINRKAPGAARTAVTAGTPSMAAPSSSLASSSHLSRRATATAAGATAVPSPLQPQHQLLQHACSARHPQRIRCGSAGGMAAAARRRAPGVCFVVSPSQRGPCPWLLLPLLAASFQQALDYSC